LELLVVGATYTTLEVHGAKINTPPKTKPTIINASHRIMWCRSVEAYGVMVLGAISGATSHRPPLPSCYGLPSIASWFKVALGWLVGAYSSHMYLRRYNNLQKFGLFMFQISTVGIDN
jgi:hypothetical protein